MNSFVVSFEIVKPDKATARNGESAGLVRHSWSGCAGYDLAEGNPIVKCAGVDGVTCPALFMRDREPRSITSIQSLGVHAAGQVSLIDPVPVHRSQFDSPTQIDVIDDDPHL